MLTKSIVISPKNEQKICYVPLTTEYVLNMIFSQIDHEQEKYISLCKIMFTIMYSSTIYYVIIQSRCPQQHYTYVRIMLLRFYNNNSSLSHALFIRPILIVRSCTD